jgi:hypothetical protein
MVIRSGSRRDCRDLEDGMKLAGIVLAYVELEA